ncbi:MAG TPA: hypothetical protein VGO08_22985, partial [Burkholderiales bacterium]|nr:hypothetical protein [Burkholderiales bacterium]
ESPCVRNPGRMTFDLALLVAFAVLAGASLIIALALGIPAYARLHAIRRREELIKTLAALDQLK